MLSLLFIIALASSQCDIPSRTGHFVVSCDSIAFRVNVPSGSQCRSNRPCGVILDIHGAGGSGAAQNIVTGLREKGAEASYIVVQPSAPGGTWSLDSHAKKIENFLRQFLEEYNDVIDENRVHSFGFSQGGYITWALLCDAGDILASIAVIGASGGDLWVHTSGGGRVAECAQTGAFHQKRAIMYHSGSADMISPVAMYYSTVSNVGGWLHGSGLEFNHQTHWLQGMFAGHCIPTTKRYSWMWWTWTNDIRKAQSHSCTSMWGNYDVSSQALAFFQRNTRSN